MLTYSYTNIGRKPTNEDSLRFNSFSYVVCDGVGGAVKGEIASNIVASTLTDILYEPIENRLRISKSLEAVINALNAKVEENPAYDGTATTLAAIFYNPSQGIYTAHVGDSRIFIVRPSSNQFWHTWDHSLVGDLVRNREISRDEGRHHPMNNRIYKAIKNGDIDKNPDPEIHFISDLKQGDRILICTDGVLESYSDLEIVELLCIQKFSIEDIGTQVKEVCSVESRDNNTAIILEIEKGDFKIDQPEKLEWSGLKSLKKEYQKIKSKSSIKEWANRIWFGMDREN